MDCSPPGFSVHGILQARILEWVAIPFSRGSFQPRDRTQVSCIAGGLLTVWALSWKPIQFSLCPITLKGVPFGHFIRWASMSFSSSRSTSLPRVTPAPDASRLHITIRGEASALLRGHACFIRCIHITVDVGAARAANGEGLSNQHSAQGPVHLGRHPPLRLREPAFSAQPWDGQVVSTPCSEAPAPHTLLFRDLPMLSGAVSLELEAGMPYDLHLPLWGRGELRGRGDTARDSPGPLRVGPSQLPWDVQTGPLDIYRWCSSPRSQQPEQAGVPPVPSWRKG